MGQIKNIKLHIVTDIKTISKTTTTTTRTKNKKNKNNNNKNKEQQEQEQQQQHVSSSSKRGYTRREGIGTTQITSTCSSTDTCVRWCSLLTKDHILHYQWMNEVWLK